jgi:hypothetical protein
MTIGRFRASALVAAIVTIAVSGSSAHALTSSEVKCITSIAKASQNFVKSKLKLLQKCKNANLKDASCPAPAGDKVSKLEDKLTGAIGKACGTMNAFNISNMGFPGPCTDANPGNGFTLSDIQDCMKTSHTAIVDEMIDLEFDSSLTSVPPADAKCQAEVAKQGGAITICVLKNIQKCRNNVMKGKLTGVPPDLCATNDPKTAAAIQKCEDKLAAGLAKKCTAAQIASLKVCTPDQTDLGAASTCLVDTHTVLTDGPEIAIAPDLIDYEYAARGGICGDGLLNNLNEECDGASDAACPGLCGTALVPDGFFACLCKDKPRMNVAEHADADTDNGWLGLSVDGDVVEGGGYIVDLYDCDGGTGLCNAGPSCSLAPHSPCSVPYEAANGTTSDSICAGLGQGVCRKERTATGPHCYLDINKKCSLTLTPTAAPCNSPGDFCVRTFHGAPVAAAAGGISVCNTSTFMEDVVGTVNLNTNESSFKVRQGAVTRLAITQNKPCPVCGNFCAISRNRCTTDGDCNGQGPCITTSLCSDGPRKDKACRGTPPFGGPITFFGTTSIDCPPDTQIITDSAGLGLDINANPRTTGSVTLPPTFPCTNAGHSNNRCVGGGSEGRLCTTASECPGGTCNPQCFCSGQSKPNGCADACVGGSSDMEPCSADIDCPGGGFCHPSDCRVNLADTDSNQEGECSAGPVDKYCSVTSWHTCSTDAQCQTPLCTDCQIGETCQTTLRQCFVNSGITRTGTPGYPDRESAAVYCVPANNVTINGTAGFPGPGALIQREVVTVVP